MKDFFFNFEKDYENKTKTIHTKKRLLELLLYDSNQILLLNFGFLIYK